MKKLHPSQSKILRALQENTDNSLSISEIGELVNISSKGVVHHHILQLVNKGYIKRNPNNPRDYVILDSPEKAIVHISKYGMAKCGPGGGILDGTPIGQVPVSSSLLRFPATEAFIVEAKGHSMEPKIYEGDIVIAQKCNNGQHGDIVVCVYAMEVLIKKLSWIGNDMFLYSLSNNQEKFPPRRISNPEEFKIEGIVKNILHYN